MKRIPVAGGERMAKQPEGELLIVSPHFALVGSCVRLRSALGEEQYFPCTLFERNASENKVWSDALGDDTRSPLRLALENDGGIGIVEGEGTTAGHLDCSTNRCCRAELNCSYIDQRRAFAHHRDSA